MCSTISKNYITYYEKDILFLKSAIHKDWLPFSINFNSADIIRRKNQIGYHNELAKAIGIKSNFKPKVLDTTAGSGKDSFLIASLGCEVLMIERNDTIFSLLENAMLRGLKENEEIKNIITRIKLIHDNSINFLNHHQNNFDTIYIDTMFPKTNKSRLVKKNMQIFHELAGNDLDGNILLETALKAKHKRVVVKRMLKSELLNNLKPSFQIKGKIIRFDIYL